MFLLFVDTFFFLIKRENKIANAVLPLILWISNEGERVQPQLRDCICMALQFLVNFATANERNQQFIWNSMFPDLFLYYSFLFILSLCYSLLEYLELNIVLFLG